MSIIVSYFDSFDDKSMWLFIGYWTDIDNHWGPPAFTCAEASLSNFLKFSLKSWATFWRVSSYSAGLAQVSLGFRILVSTPGIEAGYCKLKMGKVLYSALAKDPSWMALMMFLVFWMLIL